MADYRLTRKAEEDLRDCFRYGVENFGLENAAMYLTGLHHKFSKLADKPLIGRNASHIPTLTRKFTQGQHIVFYRVDGTSILIARVLPKEMDFKRHL